MRAQKVGLAFGLMAMLTTPAVAQDLTFSGQVRPRFEYRDPALGGVDDAFTSMRVRLGLLATLDDQVRIFAQLQDVRLFGEETSTLGDFRADNFDLHQGYIEFTGKGSQWLRTRVGRQEVNLGGQRLVGAVGWTQQGRSLDGLRFDVTKDWGTLSVIGFKLAEETAGTIDEDSDLVAAYGTITDVGPGALDLYYIFDRTELVGPDIQQSTLGVRYVWGGEIAGRVEGSFQVGDRADENLSAFMFGARVGRRFAEGRAGLTLWYDYLSGDDDPTDGDSKVFNTLLATNHKYYGFADLFLDLPAHTANAGLQDLAAKFSWTASPTTTLGADYHMFRAANQGSLADSHFADEIDVTVRHQYTEHLNITGGLSRVFRIDALEEIGRLDEDMTWFYLMLTASF